MSMNELKKINLNWFYIIFFLGIINSLFFIYGHRLVTDSFQLLDRAFLLSEGLFVPFGPRSTNTNMIYGPLISLFAYIPLAVTGSPISIAFFVLLSQIGGFILLVKTRFLNTHKNFLITYLALYWVSPWRASEAFVWNASLLFFTAALYIYSLDYLREKKRKSDFLGTVLHGMAYMLTVQIHNSVIIFAPITLYFWYKKDIRLSFKGILFCVLLFAIMLSPTLYVITNNPSVLEANTGGDAFLFANLVSGGEAVKGLLYWLRYPSFYFGSTIFQLPKYNWEELNLLNQIWIVVKWGMALISIFGVIYTNIKFFKNTPSTFLKKITLVSFFSLALISMMSPVPFNFWHLYLIYPFTLIPVAWWLSTFKYRDRLFVFILAYFSIYSFVEASHSYKHDFRADNKAIYKKRVLDRKDYLIKKYLPFAIRVGTDQ